MFPAFFALVKPVSTIAKPACIQNTNAAPIKNQTPNTSPLTALIISSVIIFPPHAKNVETRRSYPEKRHCSTF